MSEDDDDICSNYHGGNSESNGANPPQKRKLLDRRRILEALNIAPAICEEVEDFLGMSHQTCSARFSELKRDGLIFKIGTRKTRSGKAAGIYQRKMIQGNLI